jgi:hypothetical protein
VLARPGKALQEPERTVQLYHERGGFGLVLVGGGPSGAAVRIKEVLPKSSASNAKLQPGQEVVQINGKSVVGVSVERIMMMLSVAKVRSGGEATAVTVRTGSEVTLTYMSNRHPVAPASGSYHRGVSSGGTWLDSPSPTPGTSRGVSPDHSMYSSVGHSLSSLAARDTLDDLAETDPHEAFVRIRRERDDLRQALLAERSKRAIAENRMGLTESATEAAKAMEQDYDEIVTLLEAEVAHLRAQLLASPDDKNRQLIEYRRRCIMLGCQVNKAVEAKKVSDEALEVLKTFARATKEKLEFSSKTQSTADRGLNVVSDGSLRARPFDGPLPPSGGVWSVGDACMVRIDGDDRARLAVIKSIQSGASSVAGYEQCIIEMNDVGGGNGRRQVVSMSELMPLSSNHYAVASARDLDIAHRLPGEKDFLSALERLILQDSNKALRKASEVLESEVLPYGYEEAFASDGTRYFIDHVNQITSFLHPRTKRLPEESKMTNMMPPTHH